MHLQSEWRCIGCNNGRFGKGGDAQNESERDVFGTAEILHTHSLSPANRKQDALARSRAEMQYDAINIHASRCEARKNGRFGTKRPNRRNSKGTTMRELRAFWSASMLKR